MELLDLELVAELDIYKDLVYVEDMVTGPAVILSVKDIVKDMVQSVKEIHTKWKSALIML